MPESPILIESSAFVRGEGVIRIKRGGPNTGGNSGSARGSARPRFYTPNACVRIGKNNKKKTHHGGRVGPPTPRGKVIWQPNAAA